MNKKVDQSLGKIAKGTSILFFGIIVSTVIKFSARVFIIRNISQSDYGIYGLGITILSIAFTLAILGLNNGIPKQISNLVNEEKSKVPTVIDSSILISLVSSFSTCALIYLLADYFSYVFNEPGLTFPLRILSLSIPFILLSRILIAIFRGFDRSKEKVYFHNVLRPVLFLGSLSIFYFIMGLNLLNVVYSYFLSWLLTGILFFVYSYRRSRLSINLSLSKETLKMSKTLLLFSIPLLVTSILNLVMNWTDTLMLGYFESSDVVGLYKGTYPLSRYMTKSLGIFSFIFMPVVSKLYMDNLLDEAKRTYQVVTKWLFSLSLPIFFVIFVFSEFTLGFLFGPEYRAAGLTLKLLSLGFFSHVVVGLNGQSLVAIGKNRLVLYGSLIGGLLNVILNVGLIPLFGIEGAAIASTIGYIGTNIHNSLRLYRTSKLQPFYNNYLKIVGSSIILILFFIFLRSFVVINLLSFVILTFLFSILYIVSVALLHSFDEEDIRLIEKIEKKTGLDLDKIKKVLKKFS